MYKLMPFIFMLIPGMVIAYAPDNFSGNTSRQLLNNAHGGAIKSENDAFSVIMSGDTQFARILVNPATQEEKSCSTDAYDKDCQNKGEQQIANYFHSMAVLKSMPDGQRLDAVFINGDLTEYGHKSEFKKFQALLEQGRQGMDQATMVSGGDVVNFFLGLGNHDFANNVHDCANENCASRMYDFLAGQKDNPFYQNMDVQQDHHVENNDWHNSGSLAYSTDIDNVHFIQLNNYPTYANDWFMALTHWDHWGQVYGTYYNVSSSLNWLEKDLAAARQAGKFIIICFHDPSEHFVLDDHARTFKELIEKYQVSAIFVAHYHWATGENKNVNKEIYGDVPVFQSGSSIYGQYTVVKFDPASKKMYLSVYDASDGQARQVAPYYPLQASYDLK